MRILLPIVVGVALRLAIVLAFPDMDLHGDEKDFVRGGIELMESGETELFPARPPLFIAFCAAVFHFAGPSTDAVRIVQILLEGITIWGVALLAGRTLGARAAVGAAWVCALFPDFIVFSHYLWSETISLLLLTFGVLALVVLAERPSVARALSVGLAWGLLDLAKPAHFYILPVLLLWLVVSAEREERWRMTRLTALAMIASFLVVLPWSVHISNDADEPIFICSVGPKILVSGVNYDPPPQTDFASTWGGTKARRSNEANRRTVGVAAFILEYPGMFLERAVIKWSFLWSPNSFLLRNIYKGGRGGKTPKYGHPKQMTALLRLGSVTTTMGATALATLALILGLFASRERHLRAFASLYCLTYMAMITLTPVLSRYRLPMMIFAVIYAGAILARVVRPADLRGRRGAQIGACVCFAVLIGLWWMRLPAIISALY